VLQHRSDEIKFACPKLILFHCILNLIIAFLVTLFPICTLPVTTTAVDSILELLVIKETAVPMRESRDISVGIALGYGLDDWGSVVRFPPGAGEFSLHHPAFYPMGTRALSLEIKRQGSELISLTSNAELKTPPPLNIVPC
jgi:hypothetical protein